MFLFLLCGRWEVIVSTLFAKKVLETRGERCCLPSSHTMATFHSFPTSQKWRERRRKDRERLETCVPLGCLVVKCCNRNDRITLHAKLQVVSKWHVPGSHLIPTGNQTPKVSVSLVSYVTTPPTWLSIWSVLCVTVYSNWEVAVLRTRFQSCCTV